MISSPKKVYINLSLWLIYEIRAAIPSRMDVTNMAKLTSFLLESE